MPPSVELFAVALLLDALVGDPAWLYTRIAHPVVLLGHLITALERAWNRDTLSDRQRFALGALTTAFVVSAAATAGYLVMRGVEALPGGWLIEAALASTLIAGRSLYQHIHAVAVALADSTDAARRAVSHIVGRHPASLDDAGIARAAIESAAENFSDGVTAPVMWFALLGLPGLAAYKAINTLDSMLGYRNPRYEWFGKAAACLDDAANWLPARLSGTLFVLVASLHVGASGRVAWSTMRRDATRHRSPNAGWPEAAVAGALGFALAGPRRYPDRCVDDAWMGSGRAELTGEDVHRTLALSVSAWVVLAALSAAALALAHGALPL